MVEAIAPDRIAELDEATLRSFQSELHGELYSPSDEGYEIYRRVYNAMIDKRPGLIVRPANVADVISAVNFARDNNLLLAVRGGGHNVAGLGVCDGGMVIDLSLMKGIWVDPAARVARVQGGCTGGDMDHAAHAFGLATPGGIISTTGVAGLTLGGGIGNLSRRFGLAIDNLISADLVTADGRFVKASADENPDLFWAIRGGGGNFGVVTSFEFRLHPVDMVLGGPIFFPIEKTREILEFYRDFIETAPEELNAFFAFQIGPPAPFIPEHLQGVAMAALVVCYSGPMEQAEAAVRPLREFAAPVLDLATQMPFPSLQKLFDPLLPAGLYHYWKADFDTQISDGAIEAHLKYGPQLPSFQSSMHIYPINGAVHRVGNEETAFSYRDANFTHVIAAMYPDPADTPKNVEWVKDYWSALHPYSAGAAYVNFLMEEGQDRVRASYRQNYDRLVAVKNKYDPTNLFRVNQNIAPTV